MKLNIQSKILFSFLAVMLLSVSAKAGLYFDPYLGYGVGKFSLDTSLGSVDSDSNGMVAGLRLGYSKLGFFIAPEVNYYLKSDYDPSVDNANLVGNQGGDATRTTAYLTAGYKLPVLPLRFYAGYGFYSKYNVDIAGNDLTFKGTSGYKVGVGWKPGFLMIRLPLSLNFEYMVDKFDEVSGITGSSSDFPFTVGAGANAVTYSDADIKTYLLSVSVPFTLFD